MKLFMKHLSFQCAKDVAAFGFMFLIAFMAFAQFGYFLFLTQVLISDKRCIL